MPFRVERQTSARFLVPSASYDLSRNALKFKKGPPILKLRYSPPQSALLEPVCLWVDTSADFERVVFDRRFPALQLKFVHPPSEVLARSGYGTTEMGLLRDFATTAEGGFLANWLAAIGNHPDDELYYSLGSEHGMAGTRNETFALRIGTRRVATLRRLAASSGDFYSQFTKWKERHLRLAPEED
jgi:hypothetical protein